jgi:hypothetical protein
VKLSFFTPYSKLIGFVRCERKMTVPGVRTRCQGTAAPATVAMPLVGGCVGVVVVVVVDGCAAGGCAVGLGVSGCVAGVVVVAGLGVVGWTAGAGAAEGRGAASGVAGGRVTDCGEVMLVMLPLAGRVPLAASAGEPRFGWVCWIGAR